ncbi:MAG: hypothetical protein PHD43_22635 [Methylococcales bacterium]|nr:hypothetical protein [Methylococcales bacterium]
MTQRVPLIWWKPFEDYVLAIHLPAEHFGTPRKALRFPNRVFETAPRGDLLGEKLSLGVNNWPYKGMRLKKEPHRRGAERTFRENLKKYGVIIPESHQVDHVIDVQYHIGYDRDDNLWPLKKETNEAAGSKAQTDEVIWTDKKGGPPLRSAPYAIPDGRWFVIIDIRRP